MTSKRGWKKITWRIFLISIPIFYHREFFSRSQNRRLEVGGEGWAIKFTSRNCRWIVNEKIKKDFSLHSFGVSKLFVYVNFILRAFFSRGSKFESSKIIEVTKFTNWFLQLKLFKHFKHQKFFRNHRKWMHKQSTLIVSKNNMFCDFSNDFTACIDVQRGHNSIDQKKRTSSSSYVHGYLKFISPGL